MKTTYSKSRIIGLVIILFNVFGFSLSAQTIEGIVYESAGTDSIPLPGVNIYWSGSTQGTTSDANGHFSLRQPRGAELLVFSFVGFVNDSVHIHVPRRGLRHVMRNLVELNEVEVASRAKTAFVSRLSTVNTTQITSGELQKAACCNLSESFETSASVDVSYSDAVTGAKQIEMLGLAGSYTQMLAENMPSMRGLANSFGLTYVPGSWMESIQVSKGTSSVINGYESISGQINVEYKKPTGNERFFLNLFQNHMGRSEGNFNAKLKLSPRLSTMLLGHASVNAVAHDDNHDGFIDEPTGSQLNIFNRWALNAKNFESQFGLKAMRDSRSGGQLSFDKDRPRTQSNGYGVGILTERMEAFLKTGFIAANRPATSTGIQQQFTWHHLNSFFGLNDYDAHQNSYYFNALYQSFIKDTRHSFTSGLSFVYDDYREKLNDSLYTRTELVPGVFFQYTFSNGETFNLIAGLRADHHNEYGFFVTPRLHLRYNLDEHTILRASAGKGFRSPNVIAENTSLLASSRRIVFLNIPRMEEAWNAGINLSRHFDIRNRELSLSLDAYHTSFINQMIIDRDSDPSVIRIYTLQGVSFSNSLQLEANYEPVRGLDLTVAYRLNDVRMNFGDEIREKPLINKHKGLVTLSYVTHLKKWQFDATWQLNGSTRLPGIEAMTETHSPSYSIFNAQITKFFRRWSLYLGGENLSNFKQPTPVISAGNPFSNEFDASLVWGPITGITIYTGLRFSIE